MHRVRRCTSLFFFFNDTATTEIYTLSLHDALPILWARNLFSRTLARHTTVASAQCSRPTTAVRMASTLDRKSTRLNSSHANISYAVFCLKKNKINIEAYPSRRGSTPVDHRGF